MRYPGCLRTILRKSRRRRGSAVITVLLILTIGAVCAEDLTHTARFAASSRFLSIDFQAQGDVRERIMDAIVNGMRSELLFSIRAYVARRGAAALFGDQLVLELSPSHTGWYDPFRQRYIVSTNEGLEYTFEEAEQFLEFFMLLQEYRLPWSMLPDEGPVYIEIAAVLRPVKLVPALAVLGLLAQDDRMVSARRRYELATVPGIPR
jgi:hypothetical protein